MLQKLEYSQKLTLVTLLTALTACGGGGGSDSGGPGLPDGLPDNTTPDPIPEQSINYIELLNRNETEDSNIAYYTANDRTQVVRVDAGMMDHDGRRIVGGIFEGEELDLLLLNQFANPVGTLMINDSGSTDYVKPFQFLFRNSPDIFSGIIGVETQETDVPASGRAIYVGSSGIGITNGDFTAGFTGRSQVTVDFDGTATEVIISNLRGITSDTGDVFISAPGTLSLQSNGPIGSTFSLDGADVSTDIRLLEDLVDPNTVGTAQFYGPASNEVGGLFVLTDDSGNEINVVGSFIGDSDR